MKKISVALIILVILIISIIPISYALNSQEQKFFEVNKPEISKGEKLEMTINIEKIEYKKAIFKLTSDTDINEVYNEEDVELEKSEQAVTIEIDKDRLNLNEIKLYYKIPEELEIGTTIKLKDSIENAEDSEQNQSIEITIKIVENQGESTDKPQDNEQNENISTGKNEGVMNNNEANGGLKNGETSENTNQMTQISSTKSASSMLSSSSSNVSGSQETVTYNGSSNNYLSELAIEGYELNKVFNKESSTYFATVGSDISALTINTSAEVSSALTEQIELHATYYFSEIYVEANQKISKGENILKYTNGTYLTAPYDCVIEEISVPDAEEQCTNKHYITVSSINNLQISMKVSEEKIDGIELGQEVDIEVAAIEKSFKGNVINISSTASNGYFTVKIEFENDGNIKLGMTADVEIAIK